MTKILIIDDSATVRQQVRQVLAVTGYELLEAADGADGLEVLQHNGDIALALCDVNMPGMGGLDMVFEMRSIGSAVPVVMLTTEAQPSLIRRARELGVKGWIVKPFKPEMLLSIVATFAQTQTARAS